MQRNQLEAKVYKIIDLVKAHTRIEDDLVELKRTWIDAHKAARRIGGHANCARGEPILWLIGIDEANGNVPGADQNEFADWFAQVQSQFVENVAPELITHVNVPVDSVIVPALYFATDRSPYVVKNQDGGAITSDVPWRKGTMTHSATRSDLLRLLTPTLQLPTAEVVSATMMFKRHDGNARNRTDWWWGNLELFLCSNAAEPIVIQGHSIRFFIEIENLVPRLAFHNPKIRSTSPMIQTDGHEIVLHGHGAIDIDVNGYSDRHENLDGDLKCTITLRPATAERPVVVTAMLFRSLKSANEDARWQYLNAEQNQENVAIPY